MEWASSGAAGAAPAEGGDRSSAAGSPAGSLTGSAPEGFADGFAAAHRDGPEEGHVLVCEDTDHIRELIRLNLECEGYRVSEAADGVEALELLQAMLEDPDATLPDVVTVDALMPRRDGWWTVQMIRADPRLEDLPIVMVTASVQAHHRVQAEQAGVDGFIAKPFEPDELVAMVAILAASGRA